MSHAQNSIVGKNDKSFHAIAFALLSFLTAWFLAKLITSRLRRVMVTAIFLLLFACLDEMFQMFVPTRSADIRDWFADCIGILIGLSVYFILSYLKQRIALPDRELRDA